MQLAAQNENYRLAIQVEQIQCVKNENRPIKFQCIFTTAHMNTCIFFQYAQCPVAQFERNKELNA